MKILKSIIPVFILLIIAAITSAQNIVPADTIPVVFKKSLTSMLTSYLEIKDALMKGNTTEAGAKAKELHEAATKANTAGLSKDQLAFFNKQNQKILVNSQHISDNTKDFDHQCEHFDYLADEFYALLKKFHFNDQPIYYNYSPTANGGNSAHWLSDKSEMNNPYFKGATKTNDKQVEVIK